MTESLGMQPLALQQRPRNRVILVVVPVSSMKTSLAEGLPHPRLAILNPFAARLADVWPVLFAGPDGDTRKWAAAARRE